MNNVNIIGNITKDIELKQTANGKSVATVSIAVNEGFGDKQTAHYFEVQVWEKQAENLAQYCGKGSKIAVSGKLIQQRWEYEGANRSKVLIQAFDITFLDTKKETQTVELSQGEIIKSAMNEESDPFKDFGAEVVINDDDLPF